MLDLELYGEVDDKDVKQASKGGGGGGAGGGGGGQWVGACVRARSPRWGAHPARRGPRLRRPGRQKRGAD